MKQFLTKAIAFSRWFLFTVFLLPSLVSCQERGYLTPPPQLFGGSLNSISNEQTPRFSYDGRYIVFASDRQGQSRILLYDVRQRSLVNLPGLNQARVIYDRPDISADGRYIVYISEERGRPDVFVYDRQTFESEVITENLNFEVSHPTISGNGRFVSFAANRSGQWDRNLRSRNRC
jgi:Tol biopolymer transport system component